jgi:hypothetical protein
MADISGVGNRPNPSINQNRPIDRKPNANQDAPIGPPGSLGQPTGLPIPDLTGKQPVVPDVLTGKDPSQLIAAEQLRSSAGTSATDELLGLNQQPTMLGSFPAPPGNVEALRHMSPTMRRTITRNLLSKQRDQMRKLAFMVRERQKREEEDREQHQSRDHRALGEEEVAQLDQARNELGSVAQMLDLVDDLLAMQDYTFSQMGSFSKG